MTTAALRNIHQAFGAHEVLSGLDLDIESGEYLVLLGPSGCGKTTILRLIAGLQTPDQGTVLLGGESVNETPPRSRDVSMVFQGDSLYPHLSVRQSVQLALKGKHSAAEIAERMKTAVELTKIGPVLDRMPDRLSGGERRRAAIAKAIAQSCSVRLLDEPMSALDVAVRQELQDDILHWHAQNPGTSIHVTHDGNEAMRIADRIAVLDKGKVAQLATPNEIYASPATISAALSIGTPAMNMVSAQLIDGRVVSDSPNVTINIQLPSHVSDRDLRLGVRAEDLSTQAIEQAAIRFCTKASKCRRAGFEVRCDLEDQSIVTLGSKVDLGTQAEIMESGIILGAPESAVHCFDADSGERIDKTMH